MLKNHVDIITMGCSKNLVDSEKLMRLFEVNGFTCSHDSKRPQGEIVVINTCGFIQDAKQESINTILEFADAKERGKISRLYVMGCLSQRYLEELRMEIPQVDGYYGKFNYHQLIADLVNTPQMKAVPSRHITTPRHYAYLKISEGCDRHCAYCAIPIMTGTHKSRPKEDILEEVRMLVDGGVKELQVIAQELTYYGVDIDGKQHIAELVDAITQVPGVEWVRLHYAYPTHFPMDLLEVLNTNPKVCKYLDIAFQHVATSVLQRMRRQFSKEQTYDLIRAIREKVPGICLRTTLMVGFPGETEDDFQELMELVRWARFERMGAFAYSEEDGTYSAAHYQDDVPEEVKERRLDQLMALQQKISAEMMEQHIGERVRVIIDRKEGDYYVARTAYSSPEVDPEVLIECRDKRLLKGHFYEAEITGAEEFDLYARVVKPSKL